jgi:hypothetical protein
MSKQRLQHPRVGAWPLDDEVIGLRVSGTDQTYELSAPPHVQIIGTGSGCDVVLRDRTGTIAARHARLIRLRSRWLIRAMEESDSAGLFRDRVALPAFPLVPGIEIGMGAVRFVAESERSRALRRVLQRLIGFDARHRAQVDRALRTVLTTASGHGVLTVYGNGDLAAVAHLLHRHALPGQPFVRWERRTGSDPGRALAAAAGGTLCVSANDLSRALERIVERRRESTTRVQLVILVTAIRRLRPIVATVAEPIVVTPLAKRKHERLRIIHELATDAAAALGIEASRLSEPDLRTILRFDARTLPAIERATLRIVALRHWDYFARAARALGMTHAALMEWAELRGLAVTHDPGRAPRRT